MAMAEQSIAFAPASIGNVAVGFDMLGLALEDVGDWVEARLCNSEGISIDKVYGLTGEVHPYLSPDPLRNTASIAAQSFWAVHGDAPGAVLTIRKGVPLQSGMGSSAASAVAAVVAVNGLLAEPRPMHELLPFALEGERFASGGVHADNVAPSLLGGLVLCPAELLPDTVKLPVPSGINAVLLHPELQVNTAQARKSLRKHYAMSEWLEQQAYLALFIAACAADDHQLIRRSLKDVLIEPQRRAAVPCFPAVSEAAMQAGALGCSLSGSGPSIFAWTPSSQARNTAIAMEQACRRQGIACQSWVSSLAAGGARLER